MPFPLTFSQVDILLGLISLNALDCEARGDLSYPDWDGNSFSVEVTEDGRVVVSYNSEIRLTISRDGVTSWK